MAAVVHLHAADSKNSESDYYQIVTVPIPAGIVLEAGALQVMPDGKLAVASRIGDIYMEIGRASCRERVYVLV